MTFQEYEASVIPRMWRINLQIIAMQMTDYKSAKGNDEQQLWKSRILESLWRLNQKAQLCNPPALPIDLPLSAGEWVVLNANGANWCDVLTRELACMFFGATSASITKIDA